MVVACFVRHGVFFFSGPPLEIDLGELPAAVPIVKDRRRDETRAGLEKSFRREATQTLDRFIF